MTPEITIGACWDGGDFYTADAVNRLYRSCLRHATIPFEFVLYTGPLADRPGRLQALDPGIRTVPTGLASWWCGMPFFSAHPPGIRTGRLLYLDVDQVIVGSLDEICRYPSALAAMKDYPACACPRGREGDVCVSTLIMDVGAAAAVWEAYEQAGKPDWDVLTGTGPLPMAAQGLLNDPALAVPHDTLPEAWVCSYRLQVLRRGLPPDCRIVAFHGRPKPWEVSEPWIEEHWR